MKKSRLALVLLPAVLAGCAPAPELQAATEFKPRRTLTAFRSEAELQEYFAEAKKRLDEARSMRRSEAGVAAQAAPSAPAALSAVAKDAAAESVTNNQVQGVDEGGIVKVHGNHLVILRRGRLFTVDIAGDRLAPASVVDAYAPDANPSGAWYDEMLISGNTVVVIGYSYQRGGTEIGLFNIDGSGQLSYRATYHLRSNDYYSSRNYASRLIGSKLIFYTPLYLNLHGNPIAQFPAMRRWGGSVPADFQRIAPATRIYRTDEPLDPNGGVALHTVTTCDLARVEMKCEASAVLGPAGRVFHVSAGSVYVWTNSFARRGPQQVTQASVFRIPLEGGAPSALKTAGSPIDQFSFLESPDGHLNVLLRSMGRGEAMWGSEMGISERGAGQLALLRVPLDRFSDGRDSAPAEAYRVLPGAAGWTLQNRFVGPYLLYGTGANWGRPQQNIFDRSVYAVRWDDPSETRALALTHGVDRIEALGVNALVVGSSGKDLHFSTLSLGKQISLVDRYSRENAAQGETRSHGFFYKPESANDGIIGLPIRGGGEPGSRQLRQESAALLYVRNSGLKLSEIGSLASTRGAGVDDGCKASCVDWYGNSRPLFVRSRVFALMGYELVEGRFESGRVVEQRRVSYAPRRGWSPWE